jgi:hypothetical protein
VFLAVYVTVIRNAGHDQFDRSRMVTRHCASRYGILDTRSGRGVMACWRLLFAAAACCLSASTALTQGVNSGRIDGLVTDSIHAAPLPRALVLLARQTPDTTISLSRLTDAEGRFVFADLPPGDYVVALESTFLDSLELTLPSQSVTVTPGGQRHLQFAIPSGATLRLLACPDVLLPSGTGAVIGQVSDARDDRPLDGTGLVIRWSETTVDRATLRATNVTRGVEVKTDARGRFRVCGVPTETYLELRASLGSDRELLLQLVVPEAEGVIRQNVSLSQRTRSAQGVAVLDSAMSLERSGLLGGAALSGIIYGATSPLARVQVQLQGDSIAVSTDSLGRYRLGDVPAGTQVLEVRKLGYLPRQLTLRVRPGENSAPDLRLTPVATLDSIRVVGERTRYREFDARARAGAFGHFLRADDIARKSPLLTSDLVRQRPGFRIVRHGTSDLDVEVIASNGDGTSLSRPGPCYANIVIDGVPHQMINWIDPGSIAGMEIYAGPASAPVQYRSPCGTILIWTKR